MTTAGAIGTAPARVLVGLDLKEELLHQRQWRYHAGMSNHQKAWAWLISRRGGLADGLIVEAICGAFVFLATLVMRLVTDHEVVRNVVIPAMWVIGLLTGVAYFLVRAWRQPALAISVSGTGTIQNLITAIDPAKHAKLTYFENKTMRLVDVCDGWDIKGKTFKGCHLVGPAVLALSKSAICINTKTLENENATVLKLSKSQPNITGVIRVDDCTLQNCTLEGIACVAWDRNEPCETNTINSPNVQS